MWKSEGGMRKGEKGMKTKWVVFLSAFRLPNSDFKES
jgi:hypothetical protein